MLYFESQDYLPHGTGYGGCCVLVTRESWTCGCLPVTNQVDGMLNAWKLTTAAAAIVAL